MFPTDIAINKVTKRRLKKSVSKIILFKICLHQVGGSYLRITEEDPSGETSMMEMSMIKIYDFS